jgi:transcriptional regulator with XRE-family HTH domain
MNDTKKNRQILERALAEWRKVQTLKREKTSISKFADYLGYSQQAVSFWLNGDNEISEQAILKILPKLSELLGLEIYDELNLDRPDVIKNYVNENWNDAPLEERKRIAKIIEKYSSKPIPNGTESKSTPKP